MCCECTHYLWMCYFGSGVAFNVNYTIYIKREFDYNIYIYIYIYIYNFFLLQYLEKLSRDCNDKTKQQSTPPP